MNPAACCVAQCFLPIAILFALPALAAEEAPAYRAQEVSFQGADESVRLAGTLTLPSTAVAGGAKYPAVVLIHGTGPNDRDETLYGHHLFLTVAEALTGAGYAVLRYDKRGVRESTGSREAATLRDYAADAEAAFDYLRARPDIDAKRIGLLGHSEGGMIAPLIAARRSDVAWLVLLAPPAIVGRELVLYQNAQGARDRGRSEEEVQDAVASARALFDIATSEAPANEREARLTAALEAEQRARRLPERFIDEQKKSLLSPWFRDILLYDPAPTLKTLRQPVLVLYGERDHQIPPALNAEPVRVALSANSRAQVRILPRLNHLFLVAKTGAVSEYATIGGGFDATALDAIRDWLKARAVR